MRLDEAHAAITVSGLDKGRLTEEGVMVVDSRRAAGGDRAAAVGGDSYCTPGCTGAMPASVACCTPTRWSRPWPPGVRPEGRVRLEGYELAKAIAGTTTHEAVIEPPVLANSQDMPATAGQVDSLLNAGPLSGYLIVGHGLYAAGRDLAEARRHLEASTCSN